MSNPLTIVGIGEILWDLLPSGRQLGGAPANFAYCCHLLGNHASVVSRIGNDQLGNDIVESLTKAGLDHDFLQIDAARPTGTAGVQLDKGQPTFQITQSVAWDYLQWTAECESLAKATDAVCFGSLAQRSAKSRNTIRNFLRTTRADSLRIFDVNLRQDFYSEKLIRESLVLANTVKLSHEEVPVVQHLLKMNESSNDSFSRRLIDNFSLQLVCITRGAQGSFLYDGDTADEHQGFRIKVNDTIGSGDAFTAGLVDGILRRHSLAEVNEAANRLGAWVAMNSGAMPPVPQHGIQRALANLK